MFTTETAQRLGTALNLDADTITRMHASTAAQPTRIYATDMMHAGATKFDAEQRAAIIAQHELSLYLGMTGVVSIPVYDVYARDLQIGTIDFYRN